MEKKTYTLSVEITSSSFPNHPHLAVAVAKKMWSLGHDTQSISNQIGTPTKTILQIARLEEWKRNKTRSRYSYVANLDPRYIQSILFKFELSAQ